MIGSDGSVRLPRAKARDKQPDLEVEMIKTLVKTEAMSVDTQTVRVRYFELRTLRGARSATARRSCSAPAIALFSTTTR